MNTLIALSDIKYDLLKIIEPHDGRLNKNDWKTVDRLFSNYLYDLKKEGSVKDYTISYTLKEDTIVYDIGLKIATERSPKKLKIYVSTFTYPWIAKGK